MKNVLGIMDLYEDDKQTRTLTTKRPIATFHLQVVIVC